MRRRGVAEHHVVRASRNLVHGEVAVLIRSRGAAGNRHGGALHGGTGVVDKRTAHGDRVDIEVGGGEALSSLPRLWLRGNKTGRWNHVDFHRAGGRRHRNLVGTVGLHWRGEGLGTLADLHHRLLVLIRGCVVHGY